MLKISFYEVYNSSLKGFIKKWGETTRVKKSGAKRLGCRGERLGIKIGAKRLGADWSWCETTCYCLDVVWGKHGRSTK